MAELLDAARGTMRYSLREDCLAARVLESLLYEALLEGRYTGVSEACSLLRDKHVCLAGGAAGLEARLGELEGCERLVAADGASALLLQNGFLPDIVVTDLDGSWHYLLEAGREGSIIVVHAHGDNVAALKALVPRLQRLAGTNQCMPGRYSSLAPGFTDGDRALGLAVLCGAARVTLYGMDTREPTGWWSKPWLRGSVKPWPEKARKLGIAGILARLFAAYARARGTRVEYA
ncbi:6-hydroxymethylpterin diphosphokinase MptE-like protein [Pyrodictium occultum]|nr:6-hydroxymethylpterin diphosphokinase MptE-like protein [Pyrodictium occultum]